MRAPRDNWLSRRNEAGHSPLTSHPFPTYPTFCFVSPLVSFVSPPSLICASFVCAFVCDFCVCVWHLCVLCVSSMCLCVILCLCVSACLRLCVCLCLCLSVCLCVSVCLSLRACASVSRVACANTQRRVPLFCHLHMNQVGGAKALKLSFSVDYILIQSLRAMGGHCILMIHGYWKLLAAIRTIQGEKLATAPRVALNQYWNSVRGTYQASFLGHIF